MLPQYSNTYYESPSGNTQVYIIRKKTRKSFANKIKGTLTDRKKEYIQQKILGGALCLCGVIALALLRGEDGSAGFFLILMGIARIAC